MSKLLTVSLATFLYLFSLVGCADSNEPNIQVGEWKWSMTMNMSGMQMPPVEYSSCVTKDDFVPQKTNPNQQCKMLKNIVNDSSVEWEVECKSSGITSLSKGKMTYNGKTASGEINVETQGMSMKSSITGKYMGACK